jgi:RNA polymerase sigma factor (sigma-70 family)
MEASTLTTAAHSGLLARRSPLLRLQSDERLVALIRDGYDRAFEVLFDRYQARLLAFCRHLLGSQQDAEDVLQEVFVAAHTAMLADRRPITARPWLYRIARNRCLNHLRRPVPEGQDSMDIHPYENGATTLEQVQQREELREIVADMHELPETQRTAMVLREIDDLSYTEIAQAMGTTLPAVKSLLVRGRMALAESSEARLLTCGEVRLELAEAAEGLSKTSGPVRRHVRDCPSCRRYRRQLRSSTKAVAGLAPFGLLTLFHKLLGIKLGGSAAGSAAASAGGGAAAAGGGAAAAGGSGAAMGGAIAAGGAAGGTLGAKAAVGMATAALFTAGAVGVKNMQGTDGQSAPPVRAQSQPAPNTQPVHHPARDHRAGHHRSGSKHDRAGMHAKADRRPEHSGGTPAPAETAPSTEPPQPPATGTTTTGQAPPGTAGAGASGNGSSASGSSTGGDPYQVPPDPTPPPPDPTPEPPPPDPAPPPADQPPPTPGG